MQPKGAQIITHKEKKIILLNFSGLSGDLFIEKTIEGREFVKKHIKEIPLLLVDISNSFINEEANKISKKSISENKNFIKKQAVVGVAGIKKVIVKAIVQFIDKNTHFFDSQESALEWLTTD